MIRAALRVAALGYAVLRCVPNGKRPDTPRGKDDATTDAEAIRAMFHAPGNLGLLPPRGVLVLDFDAPSEADRPNATPEERVAETWRRLEAVHERAPATRNAPLLMSRSAAPHLVLRVPDGVPAPSSGPFYGPDGERWGDVRGNGRTYVVVAPSIVEGRAYGCVRPLVQPAELPAVNLAQLGLRGGAAAEVGGVGAVAVQAQGDTREVRDSATYARAVLQGAHDRLAAAPPGTRHHVALAEARALGRWASGYARAGLVGLTEADALAALEAASAANGEITEDGHAAVMRTLRDGLRFGMARPFTVTRKDATPRPSGSLEERQRRALKAWR